MQQRVLADAERSDDRHEPPAIQQQVDRGECLHWPAIDVVLNALRRGIRRSVSVRDYTKMPIGLIMILPRGRMTVGKRCLPHAIGSMATQVKNMRNDTDMR
nr:hypothetical protein [Mycobacterium uberis]